MKNLKTYILVSSADINKINYMSFKFHCISITHTASKLQRLLVLESEHGPLPGTSPVLADVIHYLNQVLCCILNTI